MKVSIEKGELVVRIPVEKNPPESKSGKTKIIAGTGGFVKTDVTHNGELVSISLNATIANR